MHRPTIKDAYRLIHQGAIALAEVEAAGMRIDVDHLHTTIDQVRKRIKKIEEKLRTFDEYKRQRKRFGANTNLNSRQQLGKILYEELGFKSKEKTAKGQRKMDGTALELVGSSYTKGFLKLEKLRKLEGTYLQGVLRETVDGYMHPFFNLHLATTYRSSSDHPNFQNIPVRDPEISKLIRQAYIPRDGHILVEIDYSALEFRVAASFWKDPAMVAYASDPDKDIHRDCAAEIFMIPERSQVSKQSRYCGKNMFVFPQIYGDYYINCAVNCWDAIEKLGLKHFDMPMDQWLGLGGITGLGPCDGKESAIPGTFEHHMKRVEDRFYEWFPEFSESKKVWWDQYKKRGWFDLMTGFRVSGVYRKNYVYNCPIQGPAFHLLLWSLIQLVKWLKKNKMKTKIVGQIHDSIVADVHKSELDDYLNEAKRTMTEDVKKHWDWIITPLEVEAEITDTNWFEKKVIEI